MGIVYETLDSCGDIDKNRFADENWYLMAWGMGDAMNMVLFLEGQSSRSPRDKEQQSPQPADGPRRTIPPLFPAPPQPEWNQ